MKSCTIAPRTLPILLALCGVLLFAESVQAARQLRFDIAIDGKEVLFFNASDKGEGDADAIWRYLDSDYSTVHGYDGYVIKADQGKPDQATLKGKIRIVCDEAGTCEVKQLKLVRSKKYPKEWRMDSAEVERTFKLRKKPK